MWVAVTTDIGNLMSSKRYNKRLGYGTLIDAIS